MRPVQFLRGVGPARAQCLSRLGVQTVLDLLLLWPRRHEDRSQFKRIGDLAVGEFQTVRATTLSTSAFRTASGRSVAQLWVSDGTGRLSAMWFNQPYMRDAFARGQEVILSGRVERRRFLTMNAPDFEWVHEDQDQTLHGGRVVPIYPLTQNLSQRTLRRLMSEAVSQESRHLIDFVPRSLREKHRLVQLNEAVRGYHFPDHLEALAAARERLVFQEFWLLELPLALRRLQRLRQSVAAIESDGSIRRRFISRLGFELTAAQRRVMEEIDAELAVGRPMNRLLQGDVGSGKTVVAAWTLLAAPEAGRQGALMVPSEVLAEQHARLLRRWVEPLGLSVALLTGGQSGRDRRQTEMEIRTGQAQLVVGTHALLHEPVQFKSLGVTVIDEQHKFGVRQRAQLRQKGSQPHCLVMTATPIPRTLAMTLYGDLDVSVLNEMPPGRLPVETRVLRLGERAAAWEVIGESLSRGEQAYIVYPLVEESERQDVAAAVASHAKIQARFAQTRVGLLHGRMERDEKDQVMEAFRSGQIGVLVSTTVVEVGVDIPNATVMVVEHAERFGLSQLHQLRGRVGRGERLSRCFLVADLRNPVTAERLKMMERMKDGFEIAEADLRLRGPGDFLGTRQHGLAPLLLADLVADADWLEKARADSWEWPRLAPELNDMQKKFLKVFLTRNGNRLAESFGETL